MAVELPTSENPFFPQVPVSIKSVSTDLYDFLERVRRYVDESSTGLFDNDRLLADSLATAGSGSSVTIVDTYRSDMTTTGWTVTTNCTMYVYKVNNLVNINFGIVGTSTANTAKFTVPYNSYAYNGMTWGGTLRYVWNNGAVSTVPARFQLANNSTLVTCYSDMNTGTWSTSGVKSVYGSFFYVASS